LAEDAYTDSTVLRRPDIPLNNPFQQLFEFARPGSKLCFDGASPHASSALVPYERLRGWCQHNRVST
jgi:hypothetical protein